MPSPDGELVGAGGLADQLPRIVGVVRTGMHVFAAASRWAPGRRGRVAATLAASLVVDTWIVRELRRGRVPAFAAWFPADVIDTAAWAATARGGMDLQAPMVGNGWTHAAIRGYQASVGREAQPVLAGSQPYPPDGPLDAAGRLARTAALWCGPFAAAATVLRRRGVAVPVHLVKWPAIGTVSGIVAGRLRAAQHLRAERAWNARAERGARLHERSARFAAVTGVEEVHDLPRVLAILGEYSPACRAASLDSRDRPRRLAEDASLGRPLGRALPYHPVDPPSARMLWLTPDQVQDLTAAVEELEAGAGHVVEGPLVFVERSATSLRFRYLDEEVELTSRPGLDDLVFDPVAAGLITSGVGKVMTARFVGISPVVGVVCGLLDVAGSAVTMRGELTGRRHVSTVLGLSTAAAGLWLAAARRYGTAERMPDGTPVFAATGATAVLGPMGHYWGRAPGWAPAAGLAVLVGWADVTRRRTDAVPMREVVAEFTVVLQYFLATYRWAERADAERVALADRLQAGYEASMRSVERRVWGEELDRYDRLQRLGRRELDRLTAEGVLPDAVHARVTADLDAVATFIADARGRYEPAVDGGAAA